MNAKTQTRPLNEPWHIQAGLANRLHDATGAQLAEFPSHWPSNDERGLRIVACVNACAGLDPAALPALIEAAEKFQGVAYLLPADAPAVIGAYDELRAALAAVRGTR